MAYKNLSDFINYLEQEDELIRITEFVSPELEITEITDRISKNNGKSLLFENTGFDFPVLINAFGSEKRMSMAIGVDNLDEVGAKMQEIFSKLVAPAKGVINKLKMLPLLNSFSGLMPKEIKGRGDCQQIIMKEPDLSRLPVLKCWPEDGGPFITLPVVHTIDPNNGIRNVGMYRMQVFDKKTTGMHWHLHKNSARHYNDYKKLGKRMPASVTLGGDPAYTYAATAPLPDNVDEYILAGFLRNQRVELVKCLTNDIFVPADVDFVIEGYVDPGEELILEGPFGDHTGFYSLADYYPKFHVTCITHRQNAVYPATIVGIPPQEDAWIGLATERIFLHPIKMTMLPEILDMHMPAEGVFHNIVIVKIKKTFAGQGVKVINSLWGAGQMMFNKIMIVVDEEVDIHNYEKVSAVINENVDPAEHITMIKGPLDVLDHSSRKMGYGSKLGIDATRKYSQEISEHETKDGEIKVEVEKIRGQFPEIIAVNENLCKKGISVLVVAINKNRKDHIREIFDIMISELMISNIKFVVFVDASVDLSDFSMVVWYAANNIDPARDSYFFEYSDGYKGVLINGTGKTKEFDGFERDWPNVIVMDDATIQNVDQRWDKLGLGEFLESPSLKYKKLVYRGGAVASE